MIFFYIFKIKSFPAAREAFQTSALCNYTNISNVECFCDSRQTFAFDISTVQLIIGDQHDSRSAQIDIMHITDQAFETVFSQDLFQFGKAFHQIRLFFSHTLFQRSNGTVTTRASLASTKFSSCSPGTTKSSLMVFPPSLPNCYRIIINY